MTKQPEPSRSPMPRPGSVVPSALAGDPDHQSPVVSKLKTVSPIGRGKSKPRPSGASNDEEVLPIVIEKRRPANPLANLGNTSHPIDVALIRAGVREETVLDDFDSVTIRERIEKNRHPLSSMLISTTIHLAIFLAMAIFVFSSDEPQPSIGIVATIDATPTPETPADVETPPVEIEIPNDNESPFDMSFDETSLDTNTDVADSQSVAPTVSTNDVDPIPAETNLQPTKTGTVPTGGGLEGRNAASRAELAARRGGTRESEMAVELGLRWIIAHQRKDGSWRFFHDDGKCDGHCGNQGKQEAATAATGLALLALMGAGYTHQSGQYQAEMQKGIDYLIDDMRVTPLGGILTSGTTRMYAHAMATLALSEAWTMTKDTSLISPVDEARKYIESVQHKRGGWKYSASRPGDLSVTGWQLMALKSCEMSGFETGKITYQLAEDFVDSVAGSSRGYGYDKPGEQPTMTAVGVLSKMYLGAEFNSGTLESSTRLLAEHGPSTTDMYFNYHATQVLHHRHDHAWQEWNQIQRDYLVDTQDKSGTHRAGSWYFPDHHGQVGGRLYTTAMSVMILEVYYRYMPLYTEDAVKKANN